jgi:kinetochore protein Mis13/DSN1
MVNKKASKSENRKRKVSEDGSIVIAEPKTKRPRPSYGKAGASSLADSAMMPPSTSKRRTKAPLKMDFNDTPEYTRTTRSTMTLRSSLTKAQETPLAAQSNGDRHVNDTSVPLPLTDTPMIRRNQEMRKSMANTADRRSSLGLRGRRASSLGNGFTAIPHPEIDPSNYIKHISAELPDPQRMKQLLAWCARRVADDFSKNKNPSSSRTELNSIQLAEEIQKDLIQNIINSQIDLSWYRRQNESSKESDLLPNPQNLENATKIDRYRENLDNIDHQISQWNKILHKPSEQASDRSKAAGSQYLNSQDQILYEQVSTDKPPYAADLAALAKTEGDLEFDVDKIRSATHQLRVLNEVTQRFMESLGEESASQFDGKRNRESDDVSSLDILRTIGRLAG